MKEENKNLHNDPRISETDTTSKINNHASNNVSRVIDIGEKHTHKTNNKTNEGRLPGVTFSRKYHECDVQKSNEQSAVSYVRG